MNSFTFFVTFLEVAQVAAVGEVLRDLREAAELAGVVVHRREDHARPEALEPSLRTRQPSSSRRPSRRAS